MSKESQGEDSPNRSTYDQVKVWVESPAMQDVLQRALPKGMDAGTWTGAAIAYVRTARDMEKCSPLSVMGCMITIASLGLRLDGVMGHAYLTARQIRDRRGDIIGYEAQVQLGYKGMIVLVYRNEDVQEVEPIIIYQNDEIDFQKGTNAYINHRWGLNEPRGERKAVYAGLRFKNGFYSFQIHNMDDVMILRRNILLQNWIKIEETPKGPKYFRKPYNKNWYEMPEYEANKYPWIGHLVPMIHKTAIRWSQKFWPTVGSDFDRAATLVGLDDSGVSQGMARLAAQQMPPELAGQGAAADTLPKGPTRAATKSRLRGADLTAQMLAEATARGSQGEQDDSQASADGETGDQDTQETAQGPGTKIDEQGDKSKDKAVQGAPSTPKRKTEKPEDKPQGAPGEMTDEEREEALQAEHAEWEAEQARRKKGD
jgi:phage RecT family recombinase